MLPLVLASAFLAVVHGLPYNSIEEVDIAPRIFNGKNAILGQFPFIVQIHDKTGFECAGSIIHPYWILTASHCLGVSSPKFKRVVAGTINKHGKDGISYKAAGKEFRRPDFENSDQNPNKTLREGYINDIGLLKLAKPIRFSNIVKQIKIGKVGPKKKVTILGWGWGSGDTLKYVQMTTSETIGLYTPIKVVGKGSYGGVGPGDSGGPMIKDDKLVGVIYTGKIGRAITARVSAYTDWIRSIIENN